MAARKYKTAKKKNTVREPEAVYVKAGNARTRIINAIKLFLKNDGRVKAAWVFGSFAKGEELPGSDIDMMIELKSGKKYSLFDIIDISFLLGEQTGKKIDLVEKGYLSGFAAKSAENDLVKIYG